MGEPELGLILEILKQLQEGQRRIQDSVTRLEAGQDALNARQDRLEAGQNALNARQDRLEAGQERLEAGQRRHEEMLRVHHEAIGQLMEAHYRLAARVDTGFKDVNGRLDGIYQSLADVQGTFAGHSDRMDGFEKRLRRIEDHVFGSPPTLS